MKILKKLSAAIIAVTVVLSTVCVSATAENLIKLDPNISTLTEEQCFNHDLEKNPYKVKIGFKIYKVNTSDGSYELLPDEVSSNNTNDVAVKPGDVIRVEVWAQTNFHCCGVQLTPAYHNAWLLPTDQSYNTYKMKAANTSGKISIENGMPPVTDFDESYGTGIGTFEKPIYMNQALDCLSSQTNHNSYVGLKAVLPNAWKGSGTNSGNWYNKNNPDILDKNGNFKYNVYRFGAGYRVDSEKEYAFYYPVLNVYQPLMTFNLTVAENALGTSAVFIPIESIVTQKESGGVSFFTAVGGDHNPSDYFNEKIPQVTSEIDPQYKGYCKYGDDTETKYDMVWDITNATITVDAENTDSNLADLKSLRAAVTQSDLADKTDCKLASLERFRAALSAAEAILAQSEVLASQQGEVDSVTKELVAATAALAKLGYCDYTLLNAELNAYKVLLPDKDMYSPVSWSNYTTSYDSANAVKKNLVNDEVGENQKKVDNAADLLQKSRLALERNKSNVTAVSYDVDGIYSVATVRYDFTVNSAASKIQILSPDGGTITFDRRSSKVTVISYNESGEVVDAKEQTPAYEIWSIDLALVATEYQVRAKYDYTWDTEYYAFTVEYAPYNTVAESFTATVGEYVDATEVTAAKGEVITFKAVTDDNAIKVQFVFADGGTSTYTRTKAVDNGDGTLTWTITRVFKQNVDINLRVKAPTGWATEYSGNVVVTMA